MYIKGIYKYVKKIHTHTHKNLHTVLKIDIDAGFEQKTPSN